MKRVQLVRLKRRIAEATEFHQIASLIEEEMSYRVDVRGIDDLLNYLSIGSCYSGLRKFARKVITRLEMRSRLKSPEEMVAFETIIAIDKFLAEPEKAKLLRLHHRWIEREKSATRPETADEQ